jgi:hypothetical protein
MVVHGNTQHKLVFNIFSLLFVEINIKYMVGTSYNVVN